LIAIRDWFRDYKIPDGKPANKFGLGNKPANKVSLNLNSFSLNQRGYFSQSNGIIVCINKEYALKVIEETNESWAKLVKRNIPAGELSLA
jgi:inorganic pyrophosphatase